MAGGFESETFVTITLPSGATVVRTVRWRLVSVDAAARVLLGFAGAATAREREETTLCDAFAELAAAIAAADDFALPAAMVAGVEVLLGFAALAALVIGVVGFATLAELLIAVVGFAALAELVIADVGFAFEAAVTEVFFAVPAATVAAVEGFPGFSVLASIVVGFAVEAAVTGVFFAFEAEVTAELVLTSLLSAAAERLADVDAVAVPLFRSPEVVGVLLVNFAGSSTETTGAVVLTVLVFANGLRMARMLPPAEVVALDVVAVVVPVDVVTSAA